MLISFIRSMKEDVEWVLAGVSKIVLGCVKVCVIGCYGVFKGVRKERHNTSK